MAPHRAGRPEDPIHRPDLPAGAFARDLRELRASAGNPTYRQMAERVFYSPGTLSTAARGEQMPTLSVTRAFAQACSADPDLWEQRWLAANTSGDPGVSPHPDHAAAESAETADQTALEAKAPTAETKSGGQPQGKTSPRRPALLAGVVLIGVTIVTGLLGVTTLAASRSTPAPTAKVTTHTSPPDDADPIQAGCDTGSVTMQHRSVAVPAASEGGELELRRGGMGCPAAWARFVPNHDLPPETLITVQIRRPSDGKTLSFAYHNDGRPVYGNILRLDRGCVIASVFLGQMTMLLTSESTECLR